VCAQLCQTYAIPTANIVSHREAHLAGYGSDHVDPTHWWGKHGYTMDGFRAAVEKLLASDQAASAPSEETPLYRIRRSWTDKASQLGAYRVLDYAKAACPAGYGVYDQTGQLVYSRLETVVDGTPDYKEAFAGKYEVNGRAGTPLRGGASDSKPLLGLLPQGANVTCYGYYTGDWLLVKVPSGKTGFVHQMYLTPADALAG
jgi:hypothetical protein